MDMFLNIIKKKLKILAFLGKICHNNNIEKNEKKEEYI